MTLTANHHLESALRGRPRRKGGLYHLTCQVCSGPFPSRRADAETCSPRCRKARQRQQEALSQINVAPTTGVAEIVSGDVTDTDTKRSGVTPDSRQLDQREYDELSWRLTLASSHCHYPGCREPRKGMVLRQHRHGGPTFCERHFGKVSNMTETATLAERGADANVYEICVTSDPYLTEAIGLVATKEAQAV